MTAREILQGLEQQALALEEKHRYDSVDRRTVRYEVDATRTNPQLAHGDLVLLVVAAYPQWFEQQAFFGHKGPAQRARPRCRLVYVAVFEGVQVPLPSRQQAVTMLRTKELPSALRPPQRAPEPPDEGIDDLFAEVHRIATGGKY